ncbi:MAG: hypothetical protein ABJA98_34815 [Acidobacteriota bacterium]
MGIGVIEGHWLSILDQAPSVVVTVGLSNVGFVDPDGERLLRRMAECGVEFDGTGCTSRYVIEKISASMGERAREGALLMRCTTKVESQVHTFEAQLSTLKAKAESARANAELKAISDLVTAKRTLDQKVAELKQAGEAAFQQAKADVEARIAEFDKSVKAMESKIKAA